MTITSTPHRGDTATARPAARVTLRRIELATRPVVVIASVLVTWQLAVLVFDLPPYLLPPPVEVAHAGVEHFPYLMGQARFTVGHIVGGFAIGVAASFTVACMMTVSTYARTALMPLLPAFQAVPKVVFAPTLIIWFGFGAPSKLAMVALLCFFPVVVNTAAGLRSTPRELVELATMYQASRWRTLRSVRIPHALPQIFTGLKVGISLAGTGAVVAEMSNPNSGLGAVVARSSQQGNMALGFAGVVVLATIGVTLFYTVVSAERLLLPWHRQTTDG